MVDANLKAHIPPEANPASLILLITLMYENDIHFSTVKTLLEFTTDQGVGSRTELQIFAFTLGLFSKDAQNTIHLSETAKVIAQIKPEVQADIIHYLIYSQLWAYREVTSSYWKSGQVDVIFSSSMIIEEVRNNAFETWGEDISFSPKSILGVRKWLEAVTPPVIEDTIFNRRHFCHPELVLLALGWTAQQMGGEIGIDYLITPERREAISRVCLLEPSALDRVLDWMLPNYPDVVQPGTSAGTYGRFLRFLKWPEIKDLLP